MDTRAAAVVIDSGDRHHCVVLKNEVETQKYTKKQETTNDTNKGMRMLSMVLVLVVLTR